MELLGCIFKDSAYCACKQRPNVFDDLRSVTRLGSPTLSYCEQRHDVCLCTALICSLFLIIKVTCSQLLDIATSIATSQTNNRCGNICSLTPEVGESAEGQETNQACLL